MCCSVKVCLVLCGQPVFAVLCCVVPCPVVLCCGSVLNIDQGAAAPSTLFLLVVAKSQPVCVVLCCVVVCRVAV